MSETMAGNGLTCDDLDHQIIPKAYWQLIDQTFHTTKQAAGVRLNE